MSEPFIRPCKVADPSVRLVAVHHAGGSAAAYFPISRSLPPDWDLLLPDLPGRGLRHTHEQSGDVKAMAAVLAADLLPWANRDVPLALFGHSLGAVVAFEAARVLEAARARVLWVGVSGSVSPDQRAKAPSPDRELSDAELLTELDGMGGMHRRMRDSPRVLQRFLSLTRDDLRALSRYRPDPDRTPLAAPMTAFGAVDDVWASPAAMTTWSRETRSRFRQRTFTGGHFYLFGAGFPRIAAEIVREVEYSTVARECSRDAMTAFLSG
ncbi:thioesterase II family protein [Catenulispora rubra]|uniref:thioesterase II family protein n=1 Tax=Catenulispora rubra TaxID=280293 RepID=UPI0018925B50|nr:alpha/beta fold hydrolase [Catenulispora rubra]